MNDYVALLIAIYIIAFGILAIWLTFMLKTLINDNEYEKNEEIEELKAKLEIQTRKANYFQILNEIKEVEKKK